jgi:GTP pyrophosphokinase
VLYASAGRPDPRLHLARPGHHDPPRGLPEREGAEAERFTPVSWDGAATSSSFRVQVAVDSWDRPRLLEDVARTFAEHGANIVSYGGTVEDQLAKNWYTVEVGDVKGLRTLLTSLRNLEAVFDAYRVTPS